MNLETLTDLITLLRYRVGPMTAISAIIAAGGVLISLIGLSSVRRIALDEEARRISGIYTPSFFERCQLWLNQTGLRVRWWEFVLVGCATGAGFASILMLMGFITLGLLMLPMGFLLYYQYLQQRRTREYSAFRDQLPDAIDDAIEYFTVENNVIETVKQLANHGPPALRPEFTAASSLIERSKRPAASLIAIGQERPEAFFRQFMDALAHNEETGSNLSDVLTRIAKAQRAQSRLHRRIAAAQAGGRMVGTIYSLAPIVFLVLMRLAGGNSFIDFYATGLGQIAQGFILLSGLLTYWLTQRIAQRGLYLRDHTSMALLKGVHRTGVNHLEIKPGEVI